MGSRDPQVGHPRRLKSWAALALVFAEAAQSEGLVRRAAQRAGLRGTAEP